MMLMKLGHNVYRFLKQVAEFGMSPTIGHISVPIPNPGQFEMRPYSDHLTKLIDQVNSVGMKCTILQLGVV